jgi:hypothetical protein
MSAQPKQLDKPELCGNCLKPYSEHYPDLKCAGKGGATTWFPKRISDALERQIALDAANTERMTQEMRQPLKDVSRAAGILERESPLFFGTGSNPLLF